MTFWHTLKYEVVCRVLIHCSEFSHHTTLSCWIPGNVILFLSAIVQCFLESQDQVQSRKNDQFDLAPLRYVRTP